MKKNIAILLSILIVFITITPNFTAYAADTTTLVPDLQIEEYNIPDNDAMQFVENLKLGWNLGNTFDAFNCYWLTNELDYESSWVGIKTTKAMIDTIKQKGFNSVRIPVSWHDHVSGTDYKISDAWMNRVQEVVNYCIDNDMYVILNIHHDNDKTYPAYFYPNTENIETSKNYISSIWKQIATKFANYDEHLIMEAMNEPRLIGHTNEWWIDPNNADVIDSIKCINQLNQVFVDTVRATGGNNASRYLMCPGYCASPDGATNANFKLPTDKSGVVNKLMVSVHAYTPWNFALQANSEGGISTWSVNDTNSINQTKGFMDTLYNKYTSQGIPVVIGEFGARDKDNLQARVEFASYYVAAARARGISCFWWDNNAFTGTGELFGLLNRSTCQFQNVEIADGMIKYAGAGGQITDPEIASGDCNNDGSIDALDFAAIKKYILNQEQTYNKSMDVNLDNAVDSIDFAIMKQYLLGIIKELPYNVGETPDPVYSDELLIGRFDTSDTAGPKFAWSNSTIKANFQGTGISVNLKSVGDNWFNVIIDNVVKNPINVSPSTTSPITLASGLTNGTHTIELVKRTEASVGEVQFLGFTVTDGELLNAPAASSKRILFIGDSITCGYGNEGASQYQSFTTKNENAYLSYGAVTARLLGADQMNISWSGKGVISNYGGNTTELMPEIYQRILPYNSTLLWDGGKWIPQVVVINLGTNDFSVGIPDKTKFTTAYKTFVDRIRTQYPNAEIYCAIGPMLNGDALINAKDYINSTVTLKNSLGDQKIHFIEFPMQDSANGYGEDWHPSVKTHEIMAKQLVAKIQSDLGW